MVLYNRDYRLLITGSDGNAIEIRDLQVTFEVTKSILSFPNLAKIDIYNLGDSTFSKLNERYVKVLLYAGYKGNVGLIFAGEVRNAFKTRQGVDTITTIYSGDGQRDWQDSRVNLTLSEQTTAKAAVEQILDTFKSTSKQVLAEIPNVKDKLGGQTLSGNSRDILDQYGEEYGFEWSIQDDELILAGNEQILDSQTVYDLNSETGLLNAPIVTEVGCECECLMLPQLTPFKAFRITTGNATVNLGNLNYRRVPRTNAIGTYRIEEVMFNGDSRGEQWTTKLKGRLLNV